MPVVCLVAASGKDAGMDEPRLNLLRAWSRGGRLIYADRGFQRFDDIPPVTPPRRPSRVPGLAGRHRARR